MSWQTKNYWRKNPLTAKFSLKTCAFLQKIQQADEKSTVDQQQRGNKCQIPKKSKIFMRAVSLL